MLDDSSSEYHAVTRDRVLMIRDDLKTRHIRPNYFCKAERWMIRKERERLADEIRELSLRKKSLQSQLESARQDVVSMPELWLLKRETVDECSQGKQEEIEGLMQSITDVLDENKQWKLEIFSLEQEIENEVASRYVGGIDVDVSDWKLVLPKLEEIEQQQSITSQLNEWNLDRIYASQLEMNKFDLLKPKDSHRTHSAAVSISGAVNMTVRKEEGSSNEKRLRVHAMMEKCAKEDDKVHKLESIVRRMRQKKIYKENERDRMVAEVRAKNRANLDSMKEEILSLNSKRSFLRKQNERLKVEYDVLCGELVDLDARRCCTTNERVEEHEEEEMPEEKVACSMGEQILIKQRVDVSNDIRLLKKQIRHASKQAGRRANRIKKEIALLWEKEIWLRHEIKWALNEISSPFVLTSSIAV